MIRSVTTLLALLAVAPSPGAHAQVAGAETTQGTYRLSGERGLRPLRIHDDGQRTYIVWSEEQLLPAVFAVNALGREETVNGFMRDGIFTIDRVDRVLLFRIDRKVARAIRSTVPELR